VIHWTKLTLRIGSTKLTPEQMEEALGIAPTKAARKGDPVSKRNSDGPKRQESLCMYESPRSEGDPPEEHVDWLLQFCESKLPEIQALSASCTYDAWIGIGSERQGGFALSHEQIVRLGAAPVNVAFDLYADSDGDSDPDNG
jgi:hypothetical protein